MSAPRAYATLRSELERRSTQSALSTRLIAAHFAEPAGTLNLTNNSREFAGSPAPLKLGSLDMGSMVGRSPPQTVVLVPSLHLGS